MIPETVNIISAVSAGEYKLRLSFDDGSQQTIDFYPFLIRAQHPAIRAYLDRDRFADFHLAYGELIWGDYDLCFPQVDLYTNTINSHVTTEPATSVA